MVREEAAGRVSDLVGKKYREMESKNPKKWVGGQPWAAGGLCLKISWGERDFILQIRPEGDLILERDHIP